MNWLNLEIKTLCAEEFLGSEPIDRATWLCLMRYCAQHENGGTIKNCETWKDRKWQQLVGITTEEACRPSTLWKWKNTSLTVWSYPADKEAEVKANRANGKKGGRPKRLNDIKPSGSESVKRKGKEGKGKEKVIHPYVKTINALFNRKDSTEWASKEQTKLNELVKRADFKNELSELTKFYNSNYQYKRRDIQTFLNNWTTELDRAREIKKPAISKFNQGIG